MELRRAVITGLGAVTPVGNNVSDYWASLIKGVSGSNLITKFDANNFKTKFACEVKNFDIQDYMDRKEARKLDPYAQFSMVAADQAIADSEISNEKTNKERIGVIMGSGIGGINVFQQEVENLISNNRVPRFNPFFIPKMISDIAAGHISIKHGLKGPNYGTVSACATSSHAIIDAFNLIRLGKADAIVAGGAEASINESGVGGFNAMQAISTKNDEYQTASRPFDATRDGFVIGEGAGSLIIEEYEHAIKRGAKIYAEIVGGGMTGDAYHLTAPHPEGDGAARVMLECINEAGLKPEDVDYINVHGTSTPLGDISEILAIKRVFEDHAYKLNISSTKSMTGHLLGAAGAIESIATVLSIKNSIIAPTINFSTPDEKIDQNLNLTLHKAQEKEVNYAITNTFGFGGHNASVLIKKYNE